MNMAIEVGRKFDAALATSIDRQAGPHVDADTSRRYADSCINSPEWLRANLDAYRHTLAPEIERVLVYSILRDSPELPEAIVALRCALRDIAYEGNDVEVGS